MVRAERIEPAMRERVWSLTPSAADRFWTGALLLSGAALIEDARDTQSLAPVSVFLAPVDRERMLRIRAGGEAIIVTFTEQTVWASIGRGPDSADIRRLLDHATVYQLVDRGRMAEMVEGAFDTILNEASGDAPGQSTIIEASLKLIFGMLLRNVPETERLPQALDRGGNLLARFRQLLENRFRDRWTVRRYASELGISADRLHDLCIGKLGKPPSRLIQDRTIYEAQMMLGRSSLSIKEITDRLGFRDPAHFSKYFKTAEGVAPRAFRNRLALAAHAREKRPPNFADWP